MKYDKRVNIEKLPKGVHQEMTVHKLANELINDTLILEDCLTMDNINEIKETINHVRYHNINLVATMIHLFDWIDFGDIIQKNEFVRLMEEYVKVQDYLDKKGVDTHRKYELNGRLVNDDNL